MEKRTFGKTGLEISPIGFGGAPIGLLETEQHQVGQVLNLLLDSGVNLIDTAAAYRGSEEAIGKAVADRRDEYVLVSKCGVPGAGPESEGWQPKDLEESINRSLQKLQTDHLDVVLLHSCSMETLQQGDALEVLTRARDAGQVRHVGYSGDNQAAAYAATLDDVAVIETSINICDQANINSVLPLAREHNLGVIAKRPIANAAWKQVSEQPGFYREYAQTYSRRLVEMGPSPAELGFKGDPADEWPDIALRFTLGQPGVHVAIIGTTNPDHAKRNIAAAEEGPLPQEALEKLRIAFRTAEQKSGDKWVAQT
jgi:aryl-alcohol dehydrogenase-like predicted oxidoreductase